MMVMMMMMMMMVMPVLMVTRNFVAQRVLFHEFSSQNGNAPNSEASFSPYELGRRVRTRSSNGKVMVAVVHMMMSLAT